MGYDERLELSLCGRCGMTDEARRVVRELRALGYAVCVFSPDELRGAESDDVEEGLVSAGWDIIDSLAKKPDPEYL